MSIEEFSKDVAKASAMFAAMRPSAQNASDALSSVSTALKTAVASFSGFMLAFDRKTQRELSLRYQLKRKGRPGWTHIKPGAR